MCDERTEKDIQQRLGITRRDFTAALSTAAIAALLPPVVNASEVVESEVMVPTTDGEADCYLVHPAEGRHPGVIMWPDIKGIRPAFRMMGKRLAQSGYTVLVINPYYRTARGEVIKSGESFSDPDVRARLRPLARTLSPETCVSDGGAFIKYLDALDSVDASRQIGTAGYCMTGSYTMRLAAAFPERIGAAASFHGGGLATDRDDSPHLLVSKMDAGLLIAIADNDDERDPRAKDLLREATGKADLKAEIEVYEGALHGWCPPDGGAYNEAQAERAWSRMLLLFERELA
jgi:carboxymethylenebutenolidase